MASVHHRAVITVLAVLSAPASAAVPPEMCDDGDPCNGEEYYDGFGCTSGEPVYCDDGVDCTEDYCDPSMGCTSYPSDWQCDDGDDCTEDYCDAGSGCTSTPSCEPTVCDDGDPCNGEEYYDGSGCTSGEPLYCDDGIDCTEDVCDPSFGCHSYPSEWACDDGIDCTEDVCDPSFGCTSYPDDWLCDDGADCTADICDPASGCTAFPADELCDDGDDCTQDFCDPWGGGCQSYPADTGEPEACNGIDDDCDGETDEFDETHDPCAGDNDECHEYVCQYGECVEDYDADVDTGIYIDMPPCFTIGQSSTVSIYATCEEHITSLTCTATNSGTGQVTIVDPAATQSDSDPTVWWIDVNATEGSESDGDISITCTDDEDDQITDTATGHVCHFRLDIYDADVFDGAQISDDAKASDGAITAENVDNDDGGSEFDQDEQTPDIGDDELIKLELTALPSANDQGDFQLTVTPDGMVDLWTVEDGALTAYSSGDDLALDEGPHTVYARPLKPSTEANDVEFELTWSEATADPEEKATATILAIESITLEGQSNGGSYPSFNTDTLPSDPNWSAGVDGPAGVRVFTGGRPGDTGARKVVTVSVELKVDPPRAVDVYVRPLDMDDPTDDETLDPNDAGGEGRYKEGRIHLPWTADDDNRGQAGGRKAGRLTGSDADGIADITLGGEGEPSTNFHVSTLPGDSYVLVASFDKDFVSTLRNEDAKDGRHVVDPAVGDGAEGEMPAWDRYMSDVLTVWRLLHVERDTMPALEDGANEASGRATSCKAMEGSTRRTLVFDKSSLTVNGESPGDDGLDDGSPMLDEPSQTQGRFQQGTVTRIGTTDTDIRIIGNDAGTVLLDPKAKWSVPYTLSAMGQPTIEGDTNRWRQTDGGIEVFLPGAADGNPDLAVDAYEGGTLKVAGVEIPGVKGNSQVDNIWVATVPASANITVTFVDDDGDDLLPHPQPSLSVAGSAFQDAYIEVVADAGGDNVVESATVNALSPLEGHYEIGSDKEAYSYWVAYVLSGFEPAHGHDHDPKEEGDSDKGVYAGQANAVTSTKIVTAGGSGCIIYREVLRDTGGLAAYESQVVAHEIGHQFGLGHSTLLMSRVAGRGQDTFSLKDQAILRAQHQWPGANAGGGE